MRLICCYKIDIVWVVVRHSLKYIVRCFQSIGFVFWDLNLRSDNVNYICLWLGNGSSGQTYYEGKLEQIC